MRVQQRLNAVGSFCSPLLFFSPSARPPPFSTDAQIAKKYSASRVEHGWLKGEVKRLKIITVVRTEPSAHSTNRVERVNISQKRKINHLEALGVVARARAQCFLFKV